MSKYQDYQWRSKHTSKTMRKIGCLIPSANHLEHEYFSRRNKFIAMRCLLAPVVVLWIPFMVIGVLAEIVSRLVLFAKVPFDKALSPLSVAAKSVFDARSSLEHGPDYSHPRILKERHGWHFPSYHYVHRWESHE